jgi:hypothetical protein
MALVKYPFSPLFVQHSAMDKWNTMEPELKKWLSLQMKMKVVIKSFFFKIEIYALNIKH